MRVSAIIPCFNAARYIGEAVESVLAQSHPVDEIIVIDDGSTDASAAAISTFGARVMLLGQPNLGMCRTRNRGVEASKGDIIAFLDSDDLWTRDSVARRLDALADDVRLAYCYGGVEQFFSPDLDERKRASLDHAAARGGRLAGSTLIRRAAFAKVGLLNPDLASGEMLDWMARADRAGLRGAEVADIALRRRIHAGNSVYKTAQYRADSLRALRGIVAARKLAPR